MWFKMGLDILNCAAMRELRKPLNAHECGYSYRQLAFVCLLSVTAAGSANDIRDASDLSRIVDTTPKQAQIMWDILLRHGVLRKGPMGYSARDWMIERGVLGDATKRQRTPSATQGQQTQYQPRNPGQKRDNNDFG